MISPAARTERSDSRATNCSLLPGTVSGDHHRDQGGGQPAWAAGIRRAVNQRGPPARDCSAHGNAGDAGNTGARQQDNRGATAVIAGRRHHARGRPRWRPGQRQARRRPPQTSILVCHPLARRGMTSQAQWPARGSGPGGAVAGPDTREPDALRLVRQSGDLNSAGLIGCVPGAGVGTAARRHGGRRSIHKRQGDAPCAHVFPDRGKPRSQGGQEGDRVRSLHCWLWKRLPTPPAGPGHQRGARQSHVRRSDELC